MDWIGWTYIARDQENVRIRRLLSVVHLRLLSVVHLLDEDDLYCLPLQHVPFT